MAPATAVTPASPGTPATAVEVPKQAVAVPLVGIVLVINEKGGHKLVFCYPPNPQPLPVRNSGGTGASARVASLKPPTISTPAYSPFHEPFGYDAQFLADLLTPRMRILDRKFLLTVDDLTFLGHPASLMEPAVGTGPLRNYSDPLGEPQSSGSINTFHIALVLQASSTYPLRELLAFLYDEVLLYLVRGLMHEQRRTRYVTQQIETMLSLQEEAVHRARGAPSSPATAHDIVERLLEASDLAQYLQRIYTMLLSGEAGRIDLNDWVRIALRPFPRPERLLRQLDPFQPEPAPLNAVARQGAFAPFKLYDTLLLLTSAQALLDSLPPQASPTLVRLINAINPVKSLQDLQKELDVSVSHLYRLAAHLVAWGKARIIHQVTIHNVYALSPSAVLDPTHSLWHQFALQFPGMSLLTVLEQFGRNRRLSEIVPSVPAQRSQYIDVIVWLLQHSFLEERFQYLFLAETVDKMRSRATSDSELVDKLVHGKAPQPAAIFRQLFPYFGSKYHVDHMLWFEGVSRADFTSMLAMFANELIVCWA